jgi:low affinity Fe/Cu permease
VKKLIILLLVSNFAFGQTAKLDSSSILIGEQINFSISNTISETEAWPTYNEFLVEGVEIIKEGKLDTTGDVISQNFIITVWDSGSYYIPPISFSANNKTEGLLLNVQTVILEEGAELKDIKQPMEAPIGWSDIWPWLVGILLFALIVFLLKKYVFNKKEEIKSEKPKVIIPADVIALKELITLEKAKIWQEGKIKEYHSSLSEIVRRYTEERFQFIALELTTDEIIDELKSKLNQEQIQNLKTLLQRADLAKFAKSKPDENENKESMQLAKHFVSQTKQKQIKNG